MRSTQRILTCFPALRRLLQMIDTTHKLDICLGLSLLVLAVAAQGCAFWQIALLTGRSPHFLLGCITSIGLTVTLFAIGDRTWLNWHEDLHVWAARVAGVPHDRIERLPESVRLSTPTCLGNRLFVTLAPAVVSWILCLLSGAAAVYTVARLAGDIYARLTLYTWVHWTLIGTVVSVHDLGVAIREVGKAKKGSPLTTPVERASANKLPHQPGEENQRKQS